MEPHCNGHVGPETLQSTEVFGCPLLTIEALKAWDEPVVSAAEEGTTFTVISLMTAICAEADFVPSATLVAVACTPPDGMTIAGPE